MEPVGHTDDADPRVYFAAERTLLAWVRTGLALMGFGFVVARFGMFLREMAVVRGVSASEQQGPSLWLGTTLVVLGVVVNFSAAVKHWHTIRRLEQSQRLRFHPLGLAAVISMSLALLGLLMAVYLLFGVLS